MQDAASQCAVVAAVVVASSHRVASQSWLPAGSKSNLTAWIVEGHVEQFQAFGHAETNWTRWQGADNPYAVEYLTFDGVWPSEVLWVACVGTAPCVGTATIPMLGVPHTWCTAQYEPYFLAKRDALPWYDERFRGCVDGSNCPCVCLCMMNILEHIQVL